jgi:hypothetical protein
MQDHIRYNAISQRQCWLGGQGVSKQALDVVQPGVCALLTRSVEHRGCVVESYYSIEACSQVRQEPAFPWPYFDGLLVSG